MGLVQEQKQAYGQPGLKIHWNTGAKAGVGTALNPSSWLWFTLSHGIVNEVYYPRIDTPSLREFGFIITDGRDFFSEEKHDAISEVNLVEYGIPNFIVTSRCRKGRYTLTKRITVDPKRNVLLQDVRLDTPSGSPALMLYALITPHLDNQTEHNSAWISETRGLTVAYASHDKVCLALFSKPELTAASVGYVGVSDGWQILQREKKLAQMFNKAPDGSVAITVQLKENSGVLALGFGENPEETAAQAEKSLRQGFTRSWNTNQKEWRLWFKGLQNSVPQAADSDLWFSSCMVLKTHMAKENPGGVVASLAIPWGEAKSDNDRAGYHMVWPRDLCEAAGGCLAIGAYEEVDAILHFLQKTQQPDGHWPQNMWIDGRPHWNGIQLDETSSPIMLVYAMSQQQDWSQPRLKEFWPMLQKAASYLISKGPVTPQGRWENEPGYSLFALAAQIAALYLAGEIAEKIGESAQGTYLKETADWWNASLERWTYVQDNELARQLEIDGYYASIVTENSPSKGKASGPAGLSLATKAEIQVSPDVLALVRFGLRAADDPRIVASIKAVDHLLRRETPFGPCWYRYRGDPYGEKPDGRPFDGSGQGRLWPILTGERAHYEIAAGHQEEAKRLAKTMAAFSSSTRLLPEQVWDQNDIPECELWQGRPTGSAMPLVWAHAEYIKLARSLDSGRIFDLPEVVKDHYVRQIRKRPIIPIWRFHNKIQNAPCSKKFRIETSSAAVVHWTDDHWQTTHDAMSRNIGLGLHYVDLDIQAETCCLEFTFYWPEAARWEGSDFRVNLENEKGQA
jgi:glucoamylase